MELQTESNSSASTLSKRPSRPSSIRVAARASPLSRAQVEEVQRALLDVTLIPTYVRTHGDIDQKSSLRSLDKTDFFTREVDALVIDGTCRIAVHAAKDLPDPLPEELTLIALTRGVDPSDVIVLRAGEMFETLPKGALIATSSQRREEMVHNLRADLTIRDIRGTIEKRLEKLFQGQVDGVVMARAALIRLNLLHLNLIPLPGETAPLQGRLAILARRDDVEMQDLFSETDGRGSSIITSSWR